MWKLSVVCSLLAFVPLAWTYSAGAPEGVCEDMTPKHPVAPQSSRFPYKVTANKAELSGGDEVEISVTGKAFAGFFLQVRNEDKKAAGQFQISDDDRLFKTVNCHGNKLSAATHKNATPKSDIKLKWKAPKQAGKYTVYATVAENGAVFWVQKPTAVIKVN